MQLDAILCNHAEAVNNLLYIAGGGIEMAFIPPGVNPPYPVSMGIGIMVTVPWQQTNQQHRVDIEFMTEDGEAVKVPISAEAMAPLTAQLTFNVGRPPGLAIGDDQHVCLAANLPNLPIPAIGKYEFVIRIDGNDERRLAYRVLPSIGTQMTIGPATPMGPGNLPLL